ncbi:hypothetical protein [Novipirellula galeiformis]|uniref:hypothetical protein n=1 Tax=Novipirellula galeiformis TaxID=2528004 RepID=UPI0011B4086B|nr:hypothetical protein [Novipirellula galeiformis]
MERRLEAAQSHHDATKVLESRDAESPESELSSTWSMEVRVPAKVVEVPEGEFISPALTQ